MRLIDADASADKIMHDIEVHLDEIEVVEIAIMTAFARALRDETEFPTIEAVNRWIPCSERLPEQGERVILAIFGSDMIVQNEGETLQDAIERSRKKGYITVGFIGSDGWYGADLFPLMVHPSYWMPTPDLPEPHEKEVLKK